jgi:hypothetical protein
MEYLIAFFCIMGFAFAIVMGVGLGAIILYKIAERLNIL